MNPTFARSTVLVKPDTEDAQKVVVSEQGVRIYDARYYTPTLTVAMDLDDAIIVARAILAFAEANPIELPEIEEDETF